LSFFHNGPVHVWPNGRLPDEPEPAVPSLGVFGPDAAVMGCIGPDDECWAIGGNDLSARSSLYRIDQTGAVEFFDLSPLVLGAKVITYDPGSGCLFIIGDRLIKWSVTTRSQVGAALYDVADWTYHRSAFKKGVVGRTLWCSRSGTARAIDTVTLATVRTERIPDWSVSDRSAVCLEPICNALWTLGVLNGSGAVKMLLDRVGAGGTTVDLVVAEIAGMAGLELKDLDVSDLANDTVQGYIIGRRSTARSCIEQLMQAFFFDAVESGGALKFVKRGRASCATLSTGDLAATAPGSDPPPPLVVTRVQDVELPALVNVLYMNPDTDYQQGHQQARRLAVATTDQSVTVELPLVLTDTQAARLAETVLFTAWTERSRFEFRTTRRFARLEPTDVITVIDGSSAHILRIIDTTLGADGVLQVKAVAEDEEVYVSTRTGVMAEFEAGTIEFQGPTTLHLIDCPMLGDGDDDPGFYCAVNGQSDAWRGATMYSSSDGVTWNEVLSFFGEATAGVAITALPDCPRFATWDRMNTVDVRMLRGDLASAGSELEVLNGANAIVLGDEILQFATAVEIDEGVYRLSNLLRGRRGTEWACGGHAVGERMVKLDAIAIQRIGMSSAAIGQSIQYKAVTFGQFLDEVAVRSFANSARACKPYAPVHIHGSRDGSGTLTITWIRRARMGGEWRDGVDVALGETTEAYEVDIFNGSTVVRTIAVSAPTASYTAAQQTADFGSVQAGISVKIYQMNTTVGRGMPGGATA
ncbi:MAG: phage tail protein, partial [Alphaproteobacteria bacterium]